MRDIEIDWFEFSVGKSAIRCVEDRCLFFGEVHAKRNGHSLRYEPPPGAPVAVRLYPSIDTP